MWWTAAAVGRFSGALSSLCDHDCDGLHPLVDISIKRTLALTVDHDAVHYWFTIICMHHDSPSLYLQYTTHVPLWVSIRSALSLSLAPLSLSLSLSFSWSLYLSLHRYGISVDPDLSIYLCRRLSPYFSCTTELTSTDVYIPLVHAEVHRE